MQANCYSTKDDSICEIRTADESAPCQDGSAHILRPSNVPSFLSKLKKTQTLEPLPLTLLEESTEQASHKDIIKNANSMNSLQASPKEKPIAREHSLGLPVTVKEVKDMLLDIVKEEHDV